MLYIADGWPEPKSGLVLLLFFSAKNEAFGNPFNKGFAKRPNNIKVNKEARIKC